MEKKKSQIWRMKMNPKGTIKRNENEIKK